MLSRDAICSRSNSKGFVATGVRLRTESMEAPGLSMRLETFEIGAQKPLTAFSFSAANFGPTMIPFPYRLTPKLAIKKTTDVIARNAAVGEIDDN